MQTVVGVGVSIDPIFVSRPLSAEWQPDTIKGVEARANAISSDNA
jgi:hypothetical protein